MKQVLVDTCIWSLALRGKQPRDTEIATQLVELITDGQALIIGPIRQELFSGYSIQQQFNKLKSKLEPFPDQILASEDFILAAEFSNACRSKGVQGSHIDFLICAVASRLDCEIFTTDKDFQHYKLHLPIKLYAE